MPRNFDLKFCSRIPFPVSSLRNVHGPAVRQGVGKGREVLLLPPLPSLSTAEAEFLDVIGTKP
jgi:hypothetical protein